MPAFLFVEMVPSRWFWGIRNRSLQLQYRFRVSLRLNTRLAATCSTFSIPTRKVHWHLTHLPLKHKNRIKRFLIFGGHIPKYIEPPKRLPFSVLALLSNKPWFAKGPCNSMMIGWWRGHNKGIEFLYCISVLARDFFQKQNFTVLAVK